MFRATALAAALLCTSCTHIAQVNIETTVGDEIRPGNHRQSAAVGATTKLNNGIKLKVKYRHRLTDFNYDKQEHGFFVGASIPVWKQQKR